MKITPGSREAYSSRLLTKFPAFYGTQRLNTVFTKARH